MAKVRVSYSSLLKRRELKRLEESLISLKSNSSFSELVLLKVLFLLKVKFLFFLISNISFWVRIVLKSDLTNFCCLINFTISNSELILLSPSFIAILRLFLFYIMQFYLILSGRRLRSKFNLSLRGWFPA